MVEGLYWWGPATLFRCPVDPDPARCDIALVGVPHSTGNGVDRARPAPRAARRAPRLGPAAARCTGRSASRPGTRAVIHDLGDVALPEANDNEASIARIATAFARASPRPARARSRSAATTRSRAASSTGLAGPGSRLTDGRPVALRAPRRAHRRLRVDPALVRRGEQRRALGRLPRPRGPGRPRAQHPDRHPRQPAHARPGSTRRASWATTSCRSTATASSAPRRASSASASASATRRCTSRSTSTASTRRVAPAVSNLEPAYTGWTVDEALRAAARPARAGRGRRRRRLPDADEGPPNGITAMVAAAAMFELIALAAERVAAGR